MKQFDPSTRRSTPSIAAHKHAHLIGQLPENPPDFVGPNRQALSSGEPICTCAKQSSTREKWQVLQGFRPRFLAREPLVLFSNSAPSARPTRSERHHARPKRRAVINEPSRARIGDKTPDAQLSIGASFVATACHPSPQSAAPNSPPRSARQSSRPMRPNRARADRPSSAPHFFKTSSISSISSAPDSLNTR